MRLVVSHVAFLPFARLPVIFNGSLGNRFDRIRRLFDLTGLVGASPDFPGTYYYQL